MKREEYLNYKKQISKDLIKQIIEIFFACDGDLKTIGEKLGKSKSRISAVLNSDIVDEMIKDGELEEEIIDKIKVKMENNQIMGRKKGGDNFIKNNEVIMENNRIVGHKKR